MSDNAEGWICDKRGGCGSEFSDDEVRHDPEVFDLPSQNGGSSPTDSSTEDPG